MTRLPRPLAPRYLRLRVVDAEDYSVELAVPRPRTRAECARGPRPCVWAACPWHQLVRLTAGGRPLLNGDRSALPAGATDAEVERWTSRAVRRLFRLEYSCGLDAIERLGGLGPRRIARMDGVTKQRIDQILAAARAKLAADPAARDAFLEVTRG